MINRVSDVEKIFPREFNGSLAVTVACIVGSYHPELTAENLERLETSLKGFSRITPNGTRAMCLKFALDILEFAD